MSLSEMQRASMSFFQQSNEIDRSVHAALKDDKRYEMISTYAIDDLMVKINEFVQDALRKNCDQSDELQTIAQNMQTAQKMLEKCKNLVQNSEPQRLCGALLNKPINRLHQVNLAYEGPLFLSNPVLYCERLPKIGFYKEEAYSEAYSIFTARLHQIHQDNIPASIKKALTDKKENKVDLIFSVSNASHLQTQARSSCGFLQYNLVTHPWVIPRAQLGDDIKKFPEMGIYEPLGVFPFATEAAVAFNALKPQEVYVHPSDNWIAFSPNNAHLGISEGFPVSAFWHVTVCEGRTIIVLQWLMNDINHPITQLLYNACLSAKSVKELLETLENKKKSCIEEASLRLVAIAKAFEKDDANASTFFDILTQGEKNRMFYLTWELHGKLMGVHPNFGAASFYGNHELSPRYHSSNTQKAQLIRKLHTEQVVLLEKLLEDQKVLFATPPALPQLSLDRVRKEKLLQPIIAALKAGNLIAAMELFDALPELDKGKVFETTWDFKNCLLGIHSDFGRASFLRSKDIDEKHHSSDADRLNILIYYLNQ